MSRQEDSQRNLTHSQPIREIPSPDDYHLSAIAKDYWNKIAPQLVEANILTPLHLDTFAALCRTYGEYVHLSQWLEEDPERYYFEVAESGYQQVSPQVTQRDKALLNLQKLWPQFGLHPKSLGQMRKHGGLGSANKNLQSFIASRYDNQASGGKRRCKALNPTARDSEKPSTGPKEKAGTNGSGKAKAKKRMKGQS